MNQPPIMTAVPLAIVLPQGTARLAEWNEVQHTATYTLDGTLISVDVQIPDDLLVEGWFWFGSTLTWRPDGPTGPFLSIWTGTYPPPACYEQARVVVQANRRRSRVIQLSLFDEAA